MNEYKEMKERHRKEINEFPMAFAFNRDQFVDGMRKLGLDPSETDRVCRISAGGFCRLDDVSMLKDMFKRHKIELQRAIEKDSTGEGFIYDMFRYELNNHEYTVTYDYTDALHSLGMTEQMLLSNKKLLHGLNLAIKSIKGYEEDIV